MGRFCGTKRALDPVADTSLAYDCDAKVPLYARRGIPDVWLIDLAGRRLHVCTQPGGAGYGGCRSLTAPAELAPTALSEARINLAEVL